MPVATTRIRFAKSSRDLRLGPAVDDAEPAAEPAQDRQRLVRPDRELEHEPLVVAVLGQQRDAKLQGLAGRARSNRAAVEADLAARGPGDAEQHLGDLRAAGADQTEEAQDLARPQIEAHLLDEARAGQAAHAQHRRPDRRRFLREKGGEVAADHVSDRLLRRQCRGRAGDDASARAQDRHVIADAQDLIDEMADEQNRDALLLEPQDDLEQPVHLACWRSRRSARP